MHDPWIEKLSDHMDGRLSDAAAREVDEHLAHCPECSAIADSLRDVVAAAHDAPTREPVRDLWIGIAARIAASPAGAAPSTAEHDATARAAALPISGRRAAAARGVRRRVSFSMPQLAAAAVLLMALSGAGVWLIVAGPDAPAAASGTIIQSAGAAPRSTSTVATGLMPTEYTEDVADLELALEENRAQLDPATVEIIQRSLESIDRAISDARDALAADPGNPYLHRQLDSTMRKKIDVLRRATGARRGQS